MSFRRDEDAAQEIIGFMLALAAVMVLFGAAVGYGVKVRDDRVADAADVAVDDIGVRLSQAINDAGTWAKKHPGAALDLTVPLVRMPGATGFIAQADCTSLTVEASNGAKDVRVLPVALGGLVVGVVSGTPEQAIIRWDPAADEPSSCPGIDAPGRIILETP